jgi:DNA repair protein SbcD/Mre11
MLPIKLLHTADVHIGMENYGRVDPATGINARVMDFLRRLNDMADYAIEQGVDIFVFAGDAYKTRDPNPTYQREFARRIKRIADAGIPVILLVGNHDLPSVSRRASSIGIFDTLSVPNVHVGDREELQEITCRRGQPLLLATVPYPLRSALIGREDAQGRSLAEMDHLLQTIMIENIRALAEQARRKPEIPAVLVGHFSVNEASHGSEQNIMIGRDATIPRSVLADPAWRYVALGHIHKHQSLNFNAQPPVIYSGSIERVDFGEENEPKGFVVAELSGEPTTWRFLRRYRKEARPFLTIRADVRNEADPTSAVVQAIWRQAAAIPRLTGTGSSEGERGAEADDSGPVGGLSEAVVRVIVTLRQEQEPLLLDREIKQALEGAYFVASLQKEVERSERQRLGGLSVETLGPVELLARYLEVKQTPKERSSLLLQHGEALIRAVNEHVEAG